MWEAMMMLRLIASFGPVPSLGRHRASLPAAMPADRLQGAIRLCFAGFRLSLPHRHRVDEEADRATQSREHRPRRLACRDGSG